MSTEVHYASSYLLPVNLLIAGTKYSRFHCLLHFFLPIIFSHRIAMCSVDAVSWPRSSSCGGCVLFQRYEARSPSFVRTWNLRRNPRIGDEQDMNGCAKDLLRPSTPRPRSTRIHQALHQKKTRTQRILKALTTVSLERIPAPLHLWRCERILCVEYGNNQISDPV